MFFENSLAKMSIGVPIKVLHEAEGHIVTCEANTGEVYRGKLIEAEDNMNCQMSNITVTYRDGRVAQLEQVYIRGSKIRFLILPDMLKNAPMLKSMKNKNQGSGAGRGKAAILKAQAGVRLEEAEAWRGAGTCSWLCQAARDGRGSRAPEHGAGLHSV
ncbi:hypothetical protein MC885_019848 [Smutsia gigantea]|nr:hypothetical protein MC885_019848 [Smutsia gigantea]